MIDYGFSKRLDETLEKWGRENVLRDVVRIIRRDRPFVLISRFQGNERDGHGNHRGGGARHAGGVQGRRRSGQVSRAGCGRPSTVAAAEALYGRRSRDRGLDASRRHGRVRPGAWRFVPGLQPASASTSSGRRTAVSSCRSPGPSISYYQRLDSVVDAPAKETSFFDGIDVTIPGIYRALRKTAPAGAEAALQAIDREVASAVHDFRMIDPAASAPALARALAATRSAQRQLGADA